jgi:hypothetical protein
MCSGVWFGVQASSSGVVACVQSAEWVGCVVLWWKVEGGKTIDDGRWNDGKIIH